MDQLTTSYVVQIVEQGNTASTVQNLQNVENQSDKTRSAMDKLADQAKSALATIGSAIAIRAAIDQYVEYEHAVSRLQGTLKATGQDSPAFRAELAAQQKAFSDTTLESGKTILSIQQLLVSFGAVPKDIKPLTQAVLDLAAGMGVDANTAAMELGKALAGVDGPLKRMGITFDENASLGEKLASAVDQVEKRWGGAGANFKKFRRRNFELDGKVCRRP